MFFHLDSGDLFRAFNLDQREALWEILEFDFRPKRPQLDLFTKQFSISEARESLHFLRCDLYEAIQEDYKILHLLARGHPIKGISKGPLSAISRRFRQNAPALYRRFTVAGVLLIRQ